MEIQWLAVLPGIFTGLVLGLTGSGGAIIAVPLLVFGLHTTIAESAPIALLSIAVSAAVATCTALHAGNCPLSGSRSHRSYRYAGRTSRDLDRSAIA